MYEFLDQVPLDALRECARGLFPRGQASALNSISRSSLVGVLFSAYAYDLLYEQPVRQALLLSLGSERLLTLAEEMGQDPSRKPYDIALAISTVPWRVGGKNVWRFAELFRIPLEYLPTRTRSNDPVEEVEPYSPPLPMFDYQEDIVSKMVEILTNEPGARFLVQLPTGAGKTRTAIEAVVEYYNRLDEREAARGSLWLAHSEELCEQAIETFRKTWQANGLCDTRLVRLWGSFLPSRNDLVGAFVFATFQKIHSLRTNKPDEFLELCGQLRLLVIDEAHKSTAPTYQAIIEHIGDSRSTSIIGLTATPGRSQEEVDENRRLARLYDGHLLTSHTLTENPVLELQRRGILSNTIRKVIDSGLEVDLSPEEVEDSWSHNDLSRRVLRRLSTDRTRNDLVLSLAERELGEGKPTILFACSVEHAKTLSLQLGLRGHRAGCIHYAMRRRQRRKLIQAFKNGAINILLNYGVLSTGFDAPNVRTVLIARPTSSIVLYSQMVGRGLRGDAVGGTQECTVIDIRDNFLNFGEVDEVYSYFSPYWKSAG